MNNALLTAGYQALKAGLLPADDALIAVVDCLADALHILPAHIDPRPIAPLPSKGIRQRIALCRGHSRGGDEGAEAPDHTTERAYNGVIIQRLEKRLKEAGVDCFTVLTYQGSGYGAAMSWLARYLLEQKATAAIEFHFNAADGRASGHETLHWANSVRGVTLAKDIDLALDDEFRGQADRGLKAITRADRGAAFLCLTHCPATIVEPFFGDNSQEWSLFNSPDGIERLVEAYYNGITNWIASQA